MPKMARFIPILALCFFVASCSDKNAQSPGEQKGVSPMSASGEPAAPPKLAPVQTLSDGLVLTSLGIAKDAQGKPVVRGVAQNTGSKIFSKVEVHFSLLDNKAQTVCMAMMVFQNLRPQGTSHFDAGFLRASQEEVVSVKVERVDIGAAE